MSASSFNPKKLLEDQSQGLEEWHQYHAALLYFQNFLQDNEENYKIKLEEENFQSILFALSKLIYLDILAQVREFGDKITKEQLSLLTQLLLFLPHAVQHPECETSRKQFEVLSKKISNRVIDKDGAVYLSNAGFALLGVGLILGVATGMWPACILFAVFSLVLIGMAIHSYYSEKAKAQVEQQTLACPKVIPMCTLFQKKRLEKLDESQSAKALKKISLDSM